MSHQVFSASIQGIDAHPVRVQIDSAPGLHALSIVGLADKSVQESQDRINAAVRNSGLEAPRSKNRRYTVNLAPADLKKEGAAYDLSIAVAYLCESRQLSAVGSDTLLWGELALDGSLSPTGGVLATSLLAKERGFREIIVPLSNAAEAAFVEGISVIGARNLTEVIGHLQGTLPIPPFSDGTSPRPETFDDSFAHIEGQFAAKRALTIAAAGAHNILMKGPPGSGKTLLSRSVIGILPPLSDTEAVEVAKVYSSVGPLPGSPRLLARPFRSPHHTSSPASIVGGGTYPKPGEVSLAHRGVLFLDEFPEFARNVLEALRQPLEDGVVTISRVSGTLTLPAKFMLIAAMNPCPCGNYGDARAICICAPASIARYAKKVSGPLVDRLDIHVTVPREIVPDGGQVKAADAGNLGQIRSSVAVAREMQAHRLSPYGTVTNSEITHKEIAKICALDRSAERLLGSLMNSRGLSMRSYHKTMKVARTIADLEQAETVKEHHVAEAVALRVPEKTG